MKTQQEMLVSFVPVIIIAILGAYLGPWLYGVAGLFAWSYGRRGL